MQEGVSSTNLVAESAARSQRDSVRVLAIVVTYNRPEMLIECIRALREQSRPPDGILVVDHSDNQAAQVVIDALDGIVLIRQPNQGGAGGFHRGMAYAWQAKFDWAWLMDDDVVPMKSALFELLQCPYATLPETGFLSSRVVDRDGNTYMTAPPSHWSESANTIARDMCYRVTAGSFVGFFVSYTAIDKCGLPLREYFIYDDDLEYSERVAQVFRGYCVVASVVVHNQPKPSANAGKTPVNWKQLYLARNRASRIVTSKAPLAKKWFRLARHAVEVSQAVSFPSMAAVKVPMWLLWGTLFFRPAIQFAKDSGPSASGKGQSP